MKKMFALAFLLIVLTSLFIRLYKITSIPPSLNWDETAAAYNAYTLTKWAKDEYGNFMPLVFTSFRDDKHPVHIYSTASVYRLFGVSDFTTRLSSVLAGVMSVMFIYLVGKWYFNSKLAGILAALFLAVSGYHIYYSRGLWEANFALFFFIVGLALFKIGLEKRNFLLPLSYFSFGIGLLSYHSAKVVVPVMVLLITLLYVKDLIKSGKLFYIGLFIFSLFIGLLFIEPRLLGIARIDQNKLSKEEIVKTSLYEKTENEYFGQAEIVFKRYIKYFGKDYLLISGDQNPRGYVGNMGQFYWVYVVLGLFGFVALIIKGKIKSAIILVAWWLLAPLPAAFSSNFSNATRAIYMIGSIQLAAAFGAAIIITKAKNKKLQSALGMVILLILFYEFTLFVRYYFVDYSKNEVFEWQYGMKQISHHVKENSDYYYVFMTDKRSQPYIFFLYYLKTPLPDLLDSVVYNESDTKSYNTVSSFENYNFGGWDTIESIPNYETLYIVDPSDYDGLRHKQLFYVQEKIEYPGGGDAFYIISGRPNE